MFFLSCATRAINMNTLSKEKLNEQKAKKNLTNLKISQLTNIPISNVDKIFSGVNKNPTLDTIQKIATVLDCSIDDFIDYKKEPVCPFYIDKKTKEIAQEILKNKNLKELFNNIKKLNKEDIEILIKLVGRFK